MTRNLGGIERAIRIVLGAMLRPCLNEGWIDHGALP